MSKADHRAAPPKRGAPPRGGPKSARPSSGAGGGGAPKGDRRPAAAYKGGKGGGGGAAGGGSKSGGGGGKPSGGKPSGPRGGGGGAPPPRAPPPPPPANRKERKELSEQRKLATKKHYGTIAETVRLWEAARPRAANDAAQRQKLAEDVARRFAGKAPDLATHHSASRVLQWALRELPAGGKARAALAAEVREAALPLARSKYGKHVVQRLLAHAQRGGAEGKAELDALLRAFRGHVVELLRHPHGADVLVDLYDAASSSQRNAMASEAYGREFALLGEGGTGVNGSAPLSHVRVLLAGADASRRRAVVASLQRALEPVLEKGLLHPPLTHRLLREYLEVAPGSLVAEAADTVAATGGNALKMVHTADGAAACCAALAYGSARDRKRLVKGMKGYVAQTAANEHAHAVVSTALTVTDDTALTGKVIVGEIKAHLQELVADKHGSRPLLALLAPSSLARYVSSAALTMMRPPPRTQRVPAAKAGGGGGKGGGGAESDEEADEEDADAAAGRKQKKQEKEDEEEAEEGGGGAAGGEANKKDEGAEPAMVDRPLGESKKDPEARRRELLAAGGLDAALVALLAAPGAAGRLLRAPGPCDVVAEVARGAEGGLLWQSSHRAGVEALHASIVEAAAARLPEAGEGGGREEGGDKGKGKGGKQQQQQQQQAWGKKAKNGGDGEEAEEAEEGGGKCGDPGCSDEHEHGQENEDDSPLLSHYYASRALRRLALASREPGAGGEGARAFVAALWDGALKGRCAVLAPTHAAKVLAAVASGGDARVREEAARELAAVVPGGDVEAWAARFVAAGGGKEEVAGKQQQQKKKGKAAAAAKPPPSAAAGVNKRKAK